jgi:hypothetical protein
MAMVNGKEEDDSSPFSFGVDTEASPGVQGCQML